MLQIGELVRVRVAVRLILILDEWSSGNAKARNLRKLLQQEFVVSGLERDVGVEIPDEVELGDLKRS